MTSPTDRDRVLDALADETDASDLSADNRRTLAEFQSLLAVSREAWEEPPDSLDDRILAEARQAAAAYRPPSFWQKLLSGPTLGLAFAGAAAVFLAVVAKPRMAPIAEPQMGATAAETRSAPAAEMAADMEPQKKEFARAEGLAQRGAALEPPPPPAELPAQRGAALEPPPPPAELPAQRQPADPKSSGPAPAKPSTRAKSQPKPPEPASDVTNNALGDSVFAESKQERTGGKGSDFADGFGSLGGRADLLETSGSREAAPRPAKAPAASVAQAPAAGLSAAPADAPVEEEMQLAKAKKDASDDGAFRYRDDPAAIEVETKAVSTSQQLGNAGRFADARAVLLTARAKTIGTTSYARLSLRLARLEVAQGAIPAARTYAREAAQKGDPATAAEARALLDTLK